MKRHRYEIEEKMLNKKVHLEVLHYIEDDEPKTNGPPPPKLPLRVMQATSLGGFPMGYIVSSPNFFEWCLGITFADKIERARRKLRKKCDRMERQSNLDEQYNEEVAHG